MTAIRSNPSDTPPPGSGPVEPPASDDRSARRAATRRFVRHYLEMVAAMVVGMVVLGPPAAWLIGLFGGHDLANFPVAAAMVMATNMTIGMSVWMYVRRHATGRVAEMAAVMYGSFLVLLPLYFAGWMSGHGLMMAGHVVMLPAMLVAMLLRRDDYTREHHTAPSTA